MLYEWLLFGHILAVAALLINHGVSMYVLYAIRAQTDRQKILDLITLSGRSTLPMYISIGLIIVFGFLLALEINVLSAWWIWISLFILLIVIALMTVTAKPYFARIKEACQLRPSGVPRVSDEELQQILRDGSATTITAIGAVGLVAIFYLMIFKPF